MQLDENVVPEQEFALRGPEPSAAKQRTVLPPFQPSTLPI